MQQSSSGGASRVTVEGLHHQGHGGHRGHGGRGGPQMGMMEAPPNRGAALNVQDGPINGHEVAQNGRDGPPSEPTNGGDRGPPNHGVAGNDYSDLF